MTPVTPARLADDDKIEIFDREGNSVKMSKAEYAEHEAKHSNASTPERRARRS